jgi:hypothetical protein
LSFNYPETVTPEMKTIFDLIIRKAIDRYAQQLHNFINALIFERLEYEVEVYYLRHPDEF